MSTSQRQPRALAMTLQDAAALAAFWGPGTEISRGAGISSITAPAGVALSTAEAAGITAERYVVAFGNQATLPSLAGIAAVLDTVIATSGVGFMAACFAAPEWGRTVFRGHLFQDNRLVAHLPHELSAHLSGRVVTIPHDIVTAGAGVIRRQLAAAREQGAALALLDAVDAPACAQVAAALEGNLLIAGAAWAAGAPPPAAAPSANATGNIAILSGALDRQTLFQLGTARAVLPFHQLDLAAAGAAERAASWAAQQTSPFIIATSVPPDRVERGPEAASMLADVAERLAAAGIRRFVITGNDSASAILDRLGVHTLQASGDALGLTWLTAGNYSLLLKPGGFGGQRLFLGEFEPHIRLNAAAE